MDLTIDRAFSRLAAEIEIADWMICREVGLGGTCLGSDKDDAQISGNLVALQAWRISGGAEVGTGSGFDLGRWFLGMPKEEEEEEERRRKRVRTEKASREAMEMDKKP